jgi:PmbA protein
MTVLSDQQLAEVALDGAPGAMDVQVQRSDLHHLRFGGGDVVLDQEVHHRTLTVRALVDGHVGTATTERSDRAGIDSARARAFAMAEAKRGPQDLEALPCPADLAAVDRGDETLAEWHLGKKAVEVGETLARAKAAGFVLAGSVSSGRSARLLASSDGVVLQESAALAKAQYIAQGAASSGYSHALASQRGDLDLDGLVGAAMRKAQLASRRVDIPVGRYDVVLEPHAVAELLEWMTGIAFTARSVEDGTSFIGGRGGEQVTGAAITLYDDASAPLGLGLASGFDGEGMAPERVTFIDGGRAGEVAYSSASAARVGAGTCTTGHSDGAGGESVNHLHMAGGDETTESLVRGMTRGLWINRFHYVNGLLDPPRATMTGLTRDGCLFVEAGEVVGGFSPMRFTESILEAFDRCDGLTEQLHAVASGWRDGGSMVVPALRLRDFAFTSKQAPA